MPPGSKSKWSKKTFLGILMVVAVAGCLLAGLELSNTTHLLHKQSATRTAKSSPAKSTTSSSNKSEQSSSATPGPSPVVPGTNDAKVPGTTTPKIKLLAPTGTFANEYDVSLSQQMVSTCTTNAGVYCKVIFTQDGVSKSLPRQLTDAGGNTAWSWTPNSIGLTSGTWHIEATASYDSQNKTTNNDPLTLEVR